MPRTEAVVSFYLLETGCREGTGGLCPAAGSPAPLLGLLQGQIQAEGRSPQSPLARRVLVISGFLLSALGRWKCCRWVGLACVGFQVHSK